ncbi:hypothetical protein HAZT_HAZT000095 [Hyalella azteca]|uniref:Integrin alpha-2 domain-containing protein n=1 Tax=Hyalella azteca TaxID=294128 RepID=A0A6A0H384_HYAAZ|nr:hypothetical protein HAZT_HAZT000095 [Hyalella azteca]
MAAASTYLLEKTSEGGLTTRASLFTSQENNFLFAYCGYSLAVGDFDDNGLEDVVVGCPQYDKDKGAIVIFYQKKSGKSFKMKMESQHRFGLQPEARFGSSISWIEDVDGDGYRELAVGAPGVDDVVGSVHIFCGRLGILPTEPCQILRAEEGMRNFGWAIASGSGNLAVSAYGQSVAVFKRLPVIIASVEVLLQGRLPYETLGPVNVSVCLSYTFRRSSDFDDSGRWFNAMLRLDDGVGNPRLIFEGTKESTKEFAVQVKANSQLCRNFQVMLQTRSQNPYAQYKLTANASLVANQPLVVPAVMNIG